MARVIRETLMSLKEMVGTHSFTIKEIKELAAKFDKPPLEISLSVEDLRNTAILLKDFALFVEFVSWAPPKKPS